MSDDATKKLTRYRSHKVVSAGKIKHVGSAFMTVEGIHHELTFSIEPGMFARYTPVPGDYLIIYDDGFKSISPRSAFENGYDKVT